MFGVISVSQDVQADEFGERFYNQTPAGMADYTVPQEEIPDIAMDEVAQELQDIMPASGDENQSDEDISNNIDYGETNKD